MNEKSTNTISSIILILLSFLILYGCYLAYLNILNVKEGFQSTHNDEFCLQETKALGASIINIDGELAMVWSSPRHTEATVQKAALALTQCHEYKLSAFCAGELCDEGAVEIKLKKQQQ